MHLQETRVFIGLGFPYEGPAPLEAIASGCYFLNPRFNPSLNRDNTKFFKDKPTLRTLSSQNPYAERFIGKPYVYTVDISNRQEVDDALKDMLAHEVKDVVGLIGTRLFTHTYADTHTHTHTCTHT